MGERTDRGEFDWTPLKTDSSVEWADLFESLGPSSLLVIIENRMSVRLRSRLTPEDVLQEAFLLAWKDRGKLEWRGLRAFRSWFLSLLDHRIHDLADGEGALKRGGGDMIGFLSELLPRNGTGSREAYELAASTTPSKLVRHREEANVMKKALDSLPEELRVVVHLRLLEELSVQETAARLEIGESAVKHRLRRGLALYREALRPFT